ncbi:MAG TPA: glycosyltransferase family 2 protein, partial [Actinomycetota bacterium]|nr:glycosyltransferase family 2 protein [Actinomycetota bacterium]
MASPPEKVDASGAGLVAAPTYNPQVMTVVHPFSVDLPIDISVVLPCLNEEAAIAGVIEEAWQGIEATGLRGEVIVVDNGSTDNSIKIAEGMAARVIHEPRKGYGSAYLAGLAQARGEYIVMADSDGTYDLTQTKDLIDCLERGNDMVLGSRFRGHIHRGAMPWTHRWIGNPVLTALLNILFGVRVSDAHCGLRCVRRSALPKLQLQAIGMEFASEMILKAGRRGLKIAEVPIEYRPRTGTSKLSSLRDGWRHLRLMLVYSSTLLFL